MAETAKNPDTDIVFNLDTALQKNLGGSGDWFLELQDEIRFDAEHPNLPTRHKDFISGLPERHAKLAAELARPLGDSALQAS